MESLIRPFSLRSTPMKGFLVQFSATIRAITKPTYAIFRTDAELSRSLESKATFLWRIATKTSFFIMKGRPADAPNLVKPEGTSSRYSRAMNYHYLCLSALKGRAYLHKDPHEFVSGNLTCFQPGRTRLYRRNSSHLSH